MKRIVSGEKSKGIGRRAVALLAKRAFREHDATHLWLSVYTENARARRTYASLGFDVLSAPESGRRRLAAAVGGFSDRSLVMVLPHRAG